MRALLLFIRRPPMLLAIAVALAALISLAFAAGRSTTPGCSITAPDVNLPAQLRTLGEFDQPFDTADPRDLQDAAVRAAGALHSDLVGATPGTPVAERADGKDGHDALVVPLSEATGGSSSSPQRVVALVAFLRDCSGRAWYSDVDDLLHTDPSTLPQRFPTVTAEEAAARLGTDPRAVSLVWRSSPFQPLWLEGRTGGSVPAGPPQPTPG